MILVDTSVFVGFFRKTQGAPYRKMEHILENDLPYGICHYVYQELLQGALDKREFEILKAYLDPLPVFEIKYGKQSHENAALMFFDCRRKGITIRSTVDLLISQIAIENNLYLLHDDTDYTRIAEVNKKLKFY